MNKVQGEHWTDQGEAVTELILDVFKLNGRLVLRGDRLVSELGLTSARWQVLGALAYAEQPESVASHARNMGVNRQGVQRIVNELEKEGIVEFQPNPHHKRAQHVVLSKEGKALFDAAIALQTPWVNNLADGLTLEDIRVTQKVVASLKERLGDQLEGDD